MGRGVLGFCGLEAVAPAEGELLLGRGEVERALADLICLHAREQLRRTGHNKIICRFIKLIIGRNTHSSLLHSKSRQWLYFLTDMLKLRVNIIVDGGEKGIGVSGAGRGRSDT